MKSFRLKSFPRGRPKGPKIGRIGWKKLLPVEVPVHGKYKMVLIGEINNRTDIETESVGTFFGACRVINPRACFLLTAWG